MARKAKEASALEVSRYATPGLHFVGGVAGLALQVSNGGARSWILRVMVGGKRREMGLGGYPDVTLSNAREVARVARSKIQDGIDPIDDGKAKRSQLQSARAAAITFAEAAEVYMGSKEVEWKNAKHADQWRNTLKAYVYPVIGNIIVGEIEQAHILRILEPIWLTKTETATRVRGRVEKILDWTRVRGYRKGENPARWKGHLEHMLPAPRKVTPVENRPSLDYPQMAEFMSLLRQEQGVAARCLEFTILTAARSEQARAATWSEIDFENAVWTIKGGRMKGEKGMERDHRVLLCAPALALLNALPRQDSRHPFSNTKGEPLSDSALSAVIKRMQAKRVDAGLAPWVDKDNGRWIVPHGFRSTFSTWRADKTNYPEEMGEFALAHAIPDKVAAAYQRGDLLDKRRKLMRDWGAFCTQRSTAATAVARKRLRPQKDVHHA